MNISRSRMLLFSWLLPLAASAEPTQPTHEFTLQNGLKVVVREDHRAPVATSQLWFKVGSADEPPGQSGLSHALEHMVYKGSSKTCAEEASAILERLGASENAFTDKDVTVYYQTLPASQLGVAFELMTDLMSTAHLTDEEFIPELAVILEERMEHLDDPAAFALQRLATIAYPTSSYATPAIGWKHDLQRLKVADLRHWYQSRYAPGNATLIVVGDVTLDQVKTLAERYFGVLPARSFPVPRAPLEVPEPGERKIIFSQPVHAPRLIMAFNVPSLATAENRRTAHALRLLDVLLAGSNSGRIQKRLQFSRQLFSEVNSEYDALIRGDGLLILATQLSTKEHTTLDEAQAQIWQLLDELKAAPPTLDEVERARALLISRQVYARDAIEQQARHLGTLESIGLSWRLMDEEVNELNQVTPEDIRQVAVTFLTRQRLATAHVLAEKTHE
jgi:zinc protease